MIAYWLYAKEHMTPSELLALRNRLNALYANRPHLNQPFEMQYAEFMRLGGFDRPCVSEQFQRDEAQGRSHDGHMGATSD